MKFANGLIQYKVVNEKIDAVLNWTDQADLYDMFKISR